MGLAFLPLLSIDNNGTPMAIKRKTQRRFVQVVSAPAFRRRGMESQKDWWRSGYA
jgi:hypothetical protein